MIPRTTVDIGNDEFEVVKRVLKSGQFVKGGEASALEEEFARYQGSSYAATVNSGTSALHLSLLALDVNQGDEVILPPNTFAATVNAVILSGCKPVFADIDSETFTLSPELFNEKVTPQTKAVIPVHLYGQICDMKPILEIAQDNELAVLEDACQSHGAEYYGQRAGVLGDLAAFSFFPTKNMTVGGDGGIVVSNNEKLINKIKSLRDHGRMNELHVMAGFNNRLSEILAAIGRAHLQKLDSFNNHRRRIAQIYLEELECISEIKLPIETKNYKHVYHLFTIKAQERDKLKLFLKENGIGSKVMYPERLNELDYVKKITTYTPMPVNDKVSEQILSLPISGTMELDQIRKVCREIKRFYS